MRGFSPRPEYSPPRKAPIRSLLASIRAYVDGALPTICVKYGENHFSIGQGDNVLSFDKYAARDLAKVLIAQLGEDYNA